MSWFNVLAFTISFICVGILTIIGAITFMDNKTNGILLGISLMITLTFTLIKIIEDVINEFPDKR